MPAGKIVITSIGGVSSADLEAHGGALWQEPFRLNGGTFEAASVLGAKGLRLLDRATLLTMIATHKTLLYAGLLDEAPAWSGRRAPGLVLGTSFGSLSSIAGFIRDRLEKGQAALNPSVFSNTVVNSPASQTAIRFGLSTLCSTISAGWASGAEAIAYGADALRRGRADLVIAGGMEEFAGDNLAVYRDLGLEPSVPPRDTCVLLLLERESDARARGGEILAELAGRGTGFDPRGDGTGLRRAVLEACEHLAIPGQGTADETWPFELLVAGECGIAAVDDAQEAVFGSFSGPRLPPHPAHGLMDGARGAFLAAIAAFACAGELASGYNGSARSALVAAPSYTGHASALALKRYGK